MPSGHGERRQRVGRTAPRRFAPASALVVAPALWSAAALRRFPASRPDMPKLTDTARAAGRVQRSMVLCRNLACGWADAYLDYGGKRSATPLCHSPVPTFPVCKAASAKRFWPEPTPDSRVKKRRRRSALPPQSKFALHSSAADPSAATPASRQGFYKARSMAMLPLPTSIPARLALKNKKPAQTNLRRLMEEQGWRNNYGVIGPPSVVRRTFISERRMAETGPPEAGTSRAFKSASTPLVHI